MRSQPFHRPPTADAGDDLEVEVRVIFQTPNDSGDPLLLGGEEGVDEIAAAIFVQMIQIAIVHPPWAAPLRIDPLRPVGDRFPRRDARERLAATCHDAVRRGRLIEVLLVVEPLCEHRAEALVALAHRPVSPSLLPSPTGANRPELP